MLFGLTQAQIERTLLPVGEHKKPKIRLLAEKLGLRVFDKPDSQEICFVKGNYTDFMEARVAGLPGEGEILDAAGKGLGRHNGYHRYTIGQRKGLGLTSKDPLYVTAIDKHRNSISVGHKDELLKCGVSVEAMNWMQQPDIKDYCVKIRHKSRKQRVRLISHSRDTATLRIHRGETAITPGQAAVLYDGDAIVGGGWIKESF